MRILHGMLLLTLLTMSSTLPEEQPTLLGRTRQFTARFKERCLRTIKRQYQDKHKRRWWLSSGAICLVSFLSWRLGAYKMFRRKGGESETPTAGYPAEVQREEEAIDNLLGKPDIEETPRGSSRGGKHKKKHRKKTKKKKARAPADAEQKKKERAKEAPAAASSAATDRENATGTMVSKSDAEMAAEAARAAARKAKEKAGPNASLAQRPVRANGVIGAEALAGVLKAKPAKPLCKKIMRCNSALLIQRKAEQLFATRAEEGLSEAQAKERAEEDMLGQKERAREQFTQGVTKKRLSVIMESVHGGATIREDEILDTLFELATNYEHLSPDEKVTLSWLIELTGIGPAEQCKHLGHESKVRRHSSGGHKHMSPATFRKPVPDTPPNETPRPKWLDVKNRAKKKV